jgi:hypothetical protein
MAAGVFEVAVVLVVAEQLVGRRARAGDCLAPRSEARGRGPLGRRRVRSGGRRRTRRGRRWCFGRLRVCGIAEAQQEVTGRQPEEIPAGSSRLCLAHARSPKVVERRRARRLHWTTDRAGPLLVRIGIRPAPIDTILVDRKTVAIRLCGTNGAETGTQLVCPRCEYELRPCFRP